MNTRSWILLSVTILAMPVAAQMAGPTETSSGANRETLTVTNLAVPENGRSAVTRWQTKSRTEHQTEWFSVRHSTNALDGRVRTTTNSYIELGAGLNRRNANGSWQRASEEFRITGSSVVANQAGHHVRLAGNINTAGSVQVEKDGVKLQGHPLCIAYYDPVDGRSELLAELKDATGWLVSSNEVP